MPKSLKWKAQKAARALAKREDPRREQEVASTDTGFAGPQGEDGDVDEQGFSRSQQQEAMDELRPGAARFPFCGAGSSRDGSRLFSEKEPGGI